MGQIISVEEKINHLKDEVHAFIKYVGDYDHIRYKIAIVPIIQYGSEDKATVEYGYVNAKTKEREGLWLSWFDNGGVMSQEFYVKGKKEGMFVHCSLLGTRFSTEYKNDKKDGKYVVWISNKIKVEEAEYKNGKRNGKTIRYHEKPYYGLFNMSIPENNNKHEESEYKDGKRVGTFRLWNNLGVEYAGSPYDSTKHK